MSHELEQQFSVPLPPIVAWNYPTPAALARFLAEETTGVKRQRAAELPIGTNGTNAAHAAVAANGVGDEDEDRTPGRTLGGSRKPLRRRSGPPLGGRAASSGRSQGGHRDNHLLAPAAALGADHFRGVTKMVNVSQRNRLRLMLVKQRVNVEFAETVRTPAFIDVRSAGEVLEDRFQMVA